MYAHWVPTHGRTECIDVVIGELLGKCPSSPDGVWPCEPVRQVIDAIASEEVARGMAVGRYNTRGAHFRSPGGDDERGLAAQYRGWAKTIAFQYPFSAKLLENMARSYDRAAIWHDTEDNVRKRFDPATQDVSRADDLRPRDLGRQVAYLR